MTIDKLEGIRNDLVRTDDNWQQWKFPELFEVLRKWTVSDPMKPDDQVRSRNFQVRQQESKLRVMRGTIDPNCCRPEKHPSRETTALQLPRSATQSSRLPKPTGLSILQKKTPLIHLC